MIRRPRVLMAWEHGRNLGHAARLLDVADRLAGYGAALVWAIPEHELAAAWLGDEAGPRVTSPRIKIDATANGGAVHSFADILASVGFANADALGNAVVQWLDLFERLAIDRVVLDYAPAAQLAALVAGLPAVQITSGFDAPPPECPVFGIGLRGPMLDRRNQVCVERLDRTIDAVVRRLGRGQPTALSDLLAYPERWYDCIAETDPYGPRNDGTYVGPLGRMRTGAATAWPDGPAEARKAFVYLRSESQLAAALDALKASSCRVICVWPGASDAAADRLRRAGVLVETAPIDLDPILAACDLVVTYGAVAIAGRALLLGKPQLLLPVEVDKHLVASRIAALGAGRLLGTRAGAAQLQEAIASLLGSASFRSAAQDVAAKYSAGFEGLNAMCRAFLDATIDEGAARGALALRIEPDGAHGRGSERTRGH